MERLAWLAANIMNAAGRRKRAVQPRDLLPRDFYGEPLTIEQVQQELREKERRFLAAAKKAS